MPSDSRTDAQLLADARQGDDAAFGLLVRRYIRSSTLLAAQLLGDRDEAEDIVQDAFSTVYEQAHRFDAARPFAPWLYAIVRRMSSNRRAREARRARLLRLWGKGTVAEAAPVQPERALLARIEAEAARRVLPQLSPMQRACFELVNLHDLPVDEVAAMHGLAESTVRQHVFRARRALRRALEGPPADRADVS